MLTAEEIKEQFQNSFSKEIIYAEENWKLYEAVLHQTAYVPIEYTMASLRYQHAYMAGFVSQLVDLNCILMGKNGIPLGIWPISLKYENDRYRLVTNEGPVLSPLYVSQTTEKQIRHSNIECFRALRHFFSTMKEKENIDNVWEGRFLQTDLAVGNREQIWYRCMLEQGGSARVCEDLYVNLELPLEVIHEKLRKSYRSLINEGQRLWKVSLHTTVTDSEFDEYRLKHLEVAGRVTRSRESWEFQKEAVNNGDAFLILLRDSSDKLVGGGLFSVSRDEGRYDVGVYDRSLFDKPLGHVIQWESISYMKQIGIRRYKIGQRFYPGESPRPTDKELSISYYKEGFATDMFTRMIVTNNLQQEV